MNICEEGEKKITEFEVGRIYQGKMTSSLYICINPKAIRPERSGFNITFSKPVSLADVSGYTDVTDEYCLQKVNQVDQVDQGCLNYF
jgi:hypothetical protein